MKNMKKTVVTFGFIVIATMVSKILGLIRTQLIAINYGTGKEANAFFAASDIPLQFLELAYAAAITAVFIPVFNEYYQKDGKERAVKFANNFLNSIILLAIVITFLGILFTPAIIKIFLGGFDASTYELTVNLTRILFPMIIFTSITYTLVGILQSFDEFNVPATISVISNTVIILYLFLFNDTFGIKGLAVMYVIGWSLQMFYQVPFVIKKGYHYSFKINFKSEGMLKVYRLFIPILISSWVVPINKMVTNYLASYIENGAAISILTYANQVYLIIVGVFTLAISNLIFPSLSRSAAEKNYKMFRSTLRNAMRINIFILAPLMGGFIVFRQEIISVLYKSGSFTQEATNATAYALLFYSIGMIGFGMREILNRAYYALNDTKTPMRSAVIGMGINIVLSIVLAYTMGYGGLALANAISITVIGIMLFIKLQKTAFSIFTIKDLTYLIRVGISAFIMCISVFFLKEWLIKVLGDGKFMSLIIIVSSAVAGFILYYLMTLTLHVEESKMAISLLKKGRGE